MPARVLYTLVTARIIYNLCFFSVSSSYKGLQVLMVKLNTVTQVYSMKFNVNKVMSCALKLTRLKS